MPSLFFWRRRSIPVIELHGRLAARGPLSLKALGPAIDAAFKAAGRDGTVVLDIDSPGGSPVQSDLIARHIREQAERRKARVLAVIQEVGASGGYWLACAADEIRANGMSIVGSIGVVGGGFGFPDLLNRIGIERRLYTAGENKARLDPFSPERPEDVSFVKRLMSDIHVQFQNWVQDRRRGKLVDEAACFDGSFFLGDHALRLGLIDALGTLDTTIQELGGPKARHRIFRPKRRRGLRALLPGVLAAVDEATGLRLG